MLGREMILAAARLGHELCAAGLAAEDAAEAAADELMGSEPEPCAVRLDKAGKSPLAWRGGKSRLAARIIGHIPAHACYVEPFAGAAWVFFRKTPSRFEVINDANGELVNFYRVLASYPQWLEAKTRYCLYSRREFEELKKADPAALSPEERAWRFFCLKIMSYSGNGCCFRVTAGRPNLADKFQGKAAALQEAHERLRRAIIENRDWREILRLYDRKETFFYLDPPYYGHEGDYGAGLFRQADFAELAEALRGLSGRFLLSINDTPETREIFGGFEIRESFEAYYSANNSKGVRRRELLLANY